MIPTSTKTHTLNNLIVYLNELEHRLELLNNKDNIDITLRDNMRSLKITGNPTKSNYDNVNDFFKAIQLNEKCKPHVDAFIKSLTDDLLKQIEDVKTHIKTELK